MQVIPLSIPEVMFIRGTVHRDLRGFFMESYNQEAFSSATGLAVSFVQDNVSQSRRGTVRGLHSQTAPRAQGKLIQVLHGGIWGVAVDVRRQSPTYMRWAPYSLYAETGAQVWIPPGFAHGFYALQTFESSLVLYKTTDFYSPRHERRIRWDDPDLKIDWPFIGDPTLSEADATAPYLKDMEDYK